MKCKIVSVFISTILLGIIEMNAQQVIRGIHYHTGLPVQVTVKNISCVVPDERKADAVYNTLNADISAAYPATILRTHSDAILYLDAGAAIKL